MIIGLKDSETLIISSLSCNFVCISIYCPLPYPFRFLGSYSFGFICVIIYYLTFQFCFNYLDKIFSKEILKERQNGKNNA